VIGMAGTSDRLRLEQPIGLTGIRNQVTAAAKAFLDPVLAAELDATWLPAEWLWR
jgi:hypothetical protein